MSFFSLKVRKRFYIPLIVLIPTIYITLYVATFVIPKSEVKYVYKVCPAFVFYNDTLSSVFVYKWAKATTKGIIVISREDNFPSRSGEVHELTHVRQAYRTLLLYPLGSIISNKIVLECEAEAYVSETKYKSELQFIVEVLKKYYVPSISKEKIIERLEYYWNKK